MRWGGTARSSLSPVNRTSCGARLFPDPHLPSSPQQMPCTFGFSCWSSAAAARRQSPPLTPGLSTDGCAPFWKILENSGKFSSTAPVHLPLHLASPDRWISSLVFY